MAEKTERQKLQARAKELDIAANQSSEELEKQIAKAERAEARKAEREQQKASASADQDTDGETVENPAAASKGPAHPNDLKESRERASEEDNLPPADGHGGVDPEWHNDPERLLGAEELEAMKERNDGEGPQIEVATYTPVSHQEIVVNFTKLPPNTDFEFRITGPMAGALWGTLKSDDWGQAQLIRSFPAGGDYSISAKGPGIKAEAQFTVAGYDDDREYRRQKRERIASSARGRGRAKAKASEESPEVAAPVPGGNIEDPIVMGDTSDGTVKAQPTEEELQDPEKFEPAFMPAESREADADEGKDTTTADPDKEADKDETEASAAEEKAD